MGKVVDMKQRKTLARVDDETRRRKVELARGIIYKKNYAVNSDPVEAFLREQSLVPTVVSTIFGARRVEAETEMQNAFSQKLATFGFNFFDMMVVDMMHEFELGVWKNLFTHLLRILNAADKTSVNELDRRYACPVNNSAAPKLTQ